MKSAPIRFATDILRRLGEELNPNIDQGILELVKNAYDADAATCTVYLNSISQAGGSIEIRDDGDGMELDDILHGWLVLGRSRKRTAARTRKGRIPAGNKGLGRLAALRLGRTVEMVTRPRQTDNEYAVEIDWHEFDNAALVEDVNVSVVSRPRSSRKAGTTVRITDLGGPIGRMEVKRLARSLILLADPFSDDPRAFRPVLRSKEFQDLAELVERRYFDDAEYHLVAKLRDGKASAAVVDWRGNVLFEGDHQELSIRRESPAYNAPNADFDLWAFILNSQAFSTRSTTVHEVRSWIDQFGGVHLYLNGLRVGSYGNAGNDWLDMNLRRVQSPEERPSTNTSIGRVSVTDVSGRLAQKTDRSGFIEDHTFEELRAFAQDSLEWMARRRLAAAEARRRRERKTTQTRTQRSRATLKEQIERAPAELKTELNIALQKYDRERQRETDALRREVQLYRTLSTAGITAATFAHESGGNPLKVIGQSVNAIERRARRELGEKYDVLADPVSSIRNACSTLGVLSTATLRLIDADKRRLGRIDLHQVVQQVLATFAPFLDDREVELEVDLAPGQPYMRGTDAAIESILTNFLNNSLTAFESSTDHERRMLVRTEVVEDVWHLTVADNGPGIEGVKVRDIWLPGQTSRPNGTGLGLTIVRDAVSDLGGTVNAEPNGVLGGASFVVELPILGV
ncbi:MULTISPECIES: sensor histidine kinase [Micromonospora]|nr:MULTISPECIES: ATP-binding protein [Micromonospora]ODB77504.1 hypothetical protein A8711_28210 [Micromonospora sp. II]ODB79503.1 hypothetical protein A8711_25285 [Micromonospora sp. II]RQX52911.1 ATP-binding protein [Micromonospora chalcea]